jgi:hypothetical protein
MITTIQPEDASKSNVIVLRPPLRNTRGVSFGAVEGDFEPAAARDRRRVLCSIEERMPSPGDLSDFRLVGSVRLPDAVVSDLAGELGSCAGIDIQTARGAPPNERVRIDLGAQRDSAQALNIAFETVGFVAPLFIGRGQQISIRHDLENAAVILSLVPRDSGRAYLRSGHRTILHWLRQWGVEVCRRLRIGGRPNLETSSKDFRLQSRALDPVCAASWAIPLLMWFAAIVGLWCAL